MKNKSIVLQQCIPILIITFINKAASVGIDLFPILLVDRHVTAKQGATIMSTIRMAMIVGTLFSGFISDRLGMKTSVLCAYFLTGFALVTLPFFHSLIFLTAFATLAQLGMIMSNQSIRLLVTQTVDRANQKEALAWTRVVNNVGGIVSNLFAAIFAGFGVLPLMMLDGSTSLVAGIFGLRKLPNTQKKNHSLSEEKQREGESLKATKSLRQKWAAFIVCSLLMGYWGFIYELFLTGIAGKTKLLHPDSGIAIFSRSMLINTILCAALGVYASRFFLNTFRSQLFALISTTLGFAIAATYTQNISAIYLGAFMLTVGELAYGAVAQFSLIRLVPDETRSGTQYAFGMTIANLCRLIGSVVAFPWIVYGTSVTLWRTPILIVATALAALSLAYRKELTIE